MTTKVAIIGSGNIGTDLMMKILKPQQTALEIVAMVGIDPESDGLKRAERLGVKPIATGVDGLVADEVFADVEIVFDATSAKAHLYDEKVLRAARPEIRLVDLTPAAIGPFCVPVANLDTITTDMNVNMVTCGGQATAPIVHAISSTGATVEYAEIVASISSKSAGPGTRANIDEFTETTAHALEKIGGAKKGKAIIILNPAEPPVLMRDTVFVLTSDGDRDHIRAAVNARIGEVAEYVPGYRLKQDVQFEEIPEDQSVNIPGVGRFHGLKVSVFLEVEGVGDYLPAYSGNLDIMTAAALRTGVEIAAHLNDKAEEAVA
ncbi:acetaldehyde dehydrogenase (acetylating) [Tessaracoccus sp. MC1865]|uniref:acetaldehyde dehydrogenase (acetylating) n=1 Tax=unclassified Tessaracoccus TaxID=2635419 RepID=UPI00160087F6|nr:acetaldehyde dehydrogenase (acetylating) [Tessaracoccus sp. MC1865]MBB1482299.1 acetaldehyde dehydrogenase (acetylating) [Tessaracoccus sp. MC1865]MBB1509544.1 acetaldehyde dehydrogenase (acetylating) [Tessaracoccus sp. MC1756]QTO38232.1 acetaldehyde dehydrogenase (acetylating) [Tessaracoccus sp. MC1865]